MLKLTTKYFGEIEYAQADVFHFSKGLFAFEEEKEFLLLPFSGSEGSLLCLQSVATPHLAFVAMNPFSLHGAYQPLLQPEELECMGVKDSRELCYYVLCVVKNPVSSSTVNLKCPIAIHDETRQGMQVILEGTDYGMRHLLSEFGEGGGADADPAQEKR